MKQFIPEAEKALIAYTFEDFFKSALKNKKLSKYDNIYFVGDDNFVCDYLMAAVNKNVQTFGVFKSVKYVLSENESEYRKNTINSQNIFTLSVNELKNVTENNNLVFFFLNTTDLAKKETTIASLKEVEKLLSSTKNSRCVITVLLPEIQVFPSEATSLSERELSFFMEKVCKKTSESEYYFEIEKICRGFVRDNNLDVTLLRFDNVFAPDCFHTPSFDLKKIILDSAKSGNVVITDEDERLGTTATYIRNACYAVFNAAYTGLKGHVYNVAYNTISVSDIKREIFNSYKDKFSLSVNLKGKSVKQYNSLNSLVFSKLKIQRVLPFADGIKYTVAYLGDYDCSDLLDKINKIHSDKN